MLTKLRAYHELNLRKIVGEQKKADVILQMIDDGVLVLDADRKIASLNPTAAKVLGVHLPGIQGREIAEITEDEQLLRSVSDVFQKKTVSKREQGEPDHFPAGNAGPAVAL